MKHICILLLALCTTVLHAQRKPRIKGNRSVAVQQEALPPFTAIELKDDLDITLRKASEPGYEITADDNLFDVLKFEVEGETLVISSFYTITASKQLDITVDFNQLHTITIHDGSITGADIVTSNDLELRILGAARLQLEVQSSYIDLQMESQATANLNLETDSLRVALKDRADAGIYLVSGYSELHMADHSKAMLEGRAETLQTTLESASDLDAERLEADAVRAELLERSTAKLRALASLELACGGSSRTYVFGEPEITITRFTEAAEIHKRTD